MVERADWSDAMVSAVPAVVENAGRPDWGAGGEVRDAVPALTGKVARADWSGADKPALYVSNGKPAVIQIGEQSGLPVEVVREMVNSADGYDATLEMMQESAMGILDSVDDGDAFTKHFDSLSESVQSKAYKVLMAHPGASLVDVISIVEPTLTVDETYEARVWFQKWKAMAQ